MDPYGHYDFREDDNDFIPDDFDDSTSGNDETASPLEILREFWGYDDFRPGQAEIIDSVLDGHDTIGLLPTGGGKSVTFQVPSQILPGLTLVITPLVSLMKDQVDSLKKRGIRAGCLHAGLTRSETDYCLERCRQGRIKLLYVAPERIGRQSFKALLNLIELSLIVVDEAHCISQWGYDFRPSYLRISELRDRFPDVPVLALTASATPAVVDDIAQKLNLTNERRFSLSFARNNLSFIIRQTSNKFAKLRQVLDSTEGTAIVYVRSRKRTVEIAEYLSGAGISATFYHAGLDSRIKAERQDQWQNGTVRVMVATTAFGMGIDKADVRTVVHFDLPSTLEEYYQEAGRAGRDGLPSIAVVLATERDKALFDRRLNEAFPPEDFIGRVYDEMCRFLCLPMGEGFGTLFEFRPEIMCENYHLPLRPVLGALGVLSRAEYIDYTDEIDIPSRIMFVCTRHELYSLETSDLEERVIMALLRNYGGLFSDYVFIDEILIASRASCTPEQVYGVLTDLRRRHILNFIPRNRSSYVYFQANRVRSDRLAIPPEIYSQRKKNMADQHEAMKRFVFDDSRCRVRSMLEYFGEETAADCGKCDVCRRRRTAPPFDPDEFVRRLYSLLDEAADGRLDLRVLAAYCPGHLEEAGRIIDDMIADGKILKQKDIFIAKKK